MTQYFLISVCTPSCSVGSCLVTASCNSMCDCIPCILTRLIPCDPSTCLCCKHLNDQCAVHDRLEVCARAAVPWLRRCSCCRSLCQCAEDPEQKLSGMQPLPHTCMSTALSYMAADSGSNHLLEASISTALSNFKQRA